MQIHNYFYNPPYCILLYLGQFTPTPCGQMQDSDSLGLPETKIVERKRYSLRRIRKTVSIASYITSLTDIRPILKYKRNKHPLYLKG